MSAWLLAFVMALVATVIGGGLYLVPVREREPSWQWALIGAAVTLVLVFLINYMFLIWQLPVFNGASWMIWFMLDLMVVGVVFAFCGILDNESPANLAALVSVAVLVLGIGFPLGWNNFFTGQDNADQLASLLNVEMIEADPNGSDVYPPTDEQHMVVVGEQNARLTAGSVLGQDNVGTQFNLGTGDLQLVDGRMYYVFDLTFRDFPAASAANGIVPGYIMVDAEDPSAPPQLQRTPFDAEEGTPFFQIKYQLDGFFEAYLQRYVYDRYRTQYVDDLSFEIDDQGNPYYTAALTEPAVRWFQAKPVKTIVVNAQTGEITEYDIGQAPPWVDRSFSAQTARELLNWWGRYAQADYGYLWEPPANRYKVSGELNLVYTDQGPAWQALMSSINNDVAVQYVVLLDTNTLNARVYRAPTGLLVENRVIEAFQANPNDPRRLDPTGLALHQVYGRLVWVASMVPDTMGNVVVDGQPSPAPFTGVGLLDATNADATAVIIEQDKRSAFGRLSQQFATGVDNGDPSAGGRTETAQGVVEDISFNVEAGTSQVVFSLVGDSESIYTGPISGANNDSLAWSFVDTGDTVIVTFFSTGDTTIRRISSLSVVAPQAQPGG